MHCSDPTWLLSMGRLGIGGTRTLCATAAEHHPLNSASCAEGPSGSKRLVVSCAASVLAPSCRAPGLLSTSPLLHVSHNPQDSSTTPMHACFSTHCKNTWVHAHRNMDHPLGEWVAGCFADHCAALLTTGTNPHMSRRSLGGAKTGCDCVLATDTSQSVHVRRMLLCSLCHCCGPVCSRP